MKATHKVFCILIFVTMFIMYGCSEPTKVLTAEERAKIAETIMQRNQDLLAVWAKQDAFDEWMSLHADENHSAWVDNKHLLVVNHESYKSHAEIDSMFRTMLSDRTTQVTMKDESVAVLSDQAAIHFGDFTYTITRNGETSKQFLAAATTVWVLEGGVWKILHYQQSWPCMAPISVE